MYTYTAGATGFDACVPALVAGGRPSRGFRERLQDPRTRARILEGVEHARRWASRTCAWPTGSPERILLVGFKTDALKPLTGTHAGGRGEGAGQADPYDVCWTS